MHSRAALVAVLVVLSATVWAQQRDRASVPDKYKWDLTQIYASGSAWRTAKEQLEKDILSVRAFKGTLGTSPAALATALERVTALEKTLARLSAYANLQADEDTRIADHQGMRQEMTLVYTTFGSETAYIEPEILRIGSDTLQRFLVRAAPRVASLLRQRAAPARTPHAERAGRKDPRFGGAGHRRPVDDIGSLAERRVSVSDGHAQRREIGAARPADVRRRARVGQSRRSRGGDVGLFQGPRRLQPDARFDAERLDSSQPVLREGAQLRIRSRSAAGLFEHSRTRELAPD